MARILAIDPGSRRVGCALSDPLNIIASPLGVIEYRGDARLVASIGELVSRHAVSLVLVGFPVREDGYEGEGCRRSRRILERLERAGIAARLWDESWTTAQAMELMRRAGLDSRRSRSARDAVAASYILASYLDEQASGGGERA